MHHHEHLGEGTGELAHLGIPHPAEKTLPPKDRETRVERRGCIQRWAGTLILAADIIGTLGAAFWTHLAHRPPDTGTRTFILLTAIALAALGAALLAAGLVELNQRGERSLIRKAMGRADANAKEIIANREAIQNLLAAAETHNRLLAETIASIGGVEKRLAGMEQAVAQMPDYARGVTEGIQLRNGFINGFPDLSVDDFRQP